MRIHIIGGSGSGKSYLANQLANQYQIPHFDLDDIQWDNQAEEYGIKNSKEKRSELLNEILIKDDWIVEGVYYKWCKKSFELADEIYILETSLGKCKRRVIRRFIKRKLGFEKGKKETIKSLFNLLKWMQSYQIEDMQEINKIMQQYTDKVKRIK